MQGEGPVARQLGAARLLHLGRGHVEDRRARLEGMAERVLLGVRDGGDALPVAVQVGVGLRHLVAAQRHQLGEDAVLAPEQPHGADRPAQQPAQHVTAPLVAGGDSVGDQHHRAADVVGDHPQPDVVVVGVAVRAPAEVAGPLDHGVHHVDLVHVVDALEQVRHPLETHAGVDVLLRERPDDVEVLLRPDGAQLVLHEHQVPDLEVAVLELRRHRHPLGRLELALGAVLGATVVEDLRARTARSGNAHRPVVLLRPELDDPLGRQAGDLHPQPERLVVAVQDRGPQPTLVQAPTAVALPLGDQLPRELDGAFLEVVAEGEVAAHLEERAVPRRLADVLDVGRAHALLDADGAVVGRGLLAEEERLERHHPGVDEQQVGVVGKQRRRGHCSVGTDRGVVLEVSHEPPSDLRGVHQSSPSVVLVG